MEKIFKIRKGNTRVAVVLFEILVIKLPNLRIKPAYEKILEKKFLNIFSWKKIKVLGDHLYFHFLHGLIANLNEGFTYHETASLLKPRKPKFLAKTFCFVFVNIQPYYGEILPTREDLQAVFNKLPKEILNLISFCDTHDLQTDNWRVVEGEIIIIDFGGSLERSVFTRVIQGLEYYPNPK